jgi:hypothetical protein
MKKVADFMINLCITLVISLVWSLGELLFWRLLTKNRGKNDKRERQLPANQPK